MNVCQVNLCVCASKYANQNFSDGMVGLLDMFKESQEKALTINFLGTQN
jgi:hypothetical protein